MTCTDVVDGDTLLLNDCLQGCYVSASEVYYVDVVTYASAIVCVIVVTEHTELSTLTYCSLSDELGVFGEDYDTHDGTGVRDYIHVVDLARAHVAALKAIVENKGIAIYNIGTGHGYSVLDVVKAFEKANGVPVPYSIKPRRPGDIATCYCNPAKAEAELGWKAEFGIEEMCRDSWNWQKNNPNGFEE